MSLTNCDLGPKPNRSTSNSGGRIAIKWQELGAREYRRQRLVRIAHGRNGAISNNVVAVYHGEPA